MQPENKSTKGYGKMSRKQWILIYVVAAIVIYAAIYFIFFHNSSGSTGSSYGY